MWLSVKALDSISSTGKRVIIPPYSTTLKTIPLTYEPLEETPQQER